MFAVVVAAVLVLMNAAIALSDRAASLWNHTADSINTSTDVVSEIVVSTGVTTSRGDWAVHSVLWAVSGAVAVVLISRARHLVPVLAGFAVAGALLEELQGVVTTSRSGQTMDEIGNLIGLSCGIAVGLAVRWFLLARRARRAGAPAQTVA